MEPKAIFAPYASLIAGLPAIGYFLMVMLKLNAILLLALWSATWFLNLGMFMAYGMVDWQTMPLARISEQHTPKKQKMAHQCCAKKAITAEDEQEGLGTCSTENTTLPHDAGGAGGDSDCCNTVVCTHFCCFKFCPSAAGLHLLTDSPATITRHGTFTEALRMVYLDHLYPPPNFG
ncbi:MAG TPA: hypothetical protein PKD90_02275 [Phnomibacter sp.]|nr:hypothetical protein [Phnomibacter sp.]